MSTGLVSTFAMRTVVSQKRRRGLSAKLSMVLKTLERSRRLFGNWRRKTMKRQFRSILSFTIFSFSAGLLTELHAALWLPRSLSDHILFQQNEPIVLWGKSASHSKITVEIRDESSQDTIQIVQAVADANGHHHSRFDTSGDSLDIEYFKSGQTIKVCHKLRARVV